MTQKNIKIICYISIILFVVLQMLSFEIMDSLGYAVSGATILNVFYDRWLWRYNPFEKTPRIYGTYVEEAHTSFNGGMDYTSTITIRQTLSSVTVFDEIEGVGYSESVAASLTKASEDGVWKLYYTYQAHTFIPSNDNVHEGTVILYVKNNNTLTGSYFTNRKNQTYGNTTLTKRTK